MTSSPRMSTGDLQTGPRVDWVPNAEAGDATPLCTCCGHEADDGHTWEACAKRLARDLESTTDSLVSARNQLEKAKEQVTRLHQTLAVFADHGHPADWRGRPPEEEVHVIVGHPMEHVLFVSDLLRAHAVYHDVRKELER